MGRGLWLAVVVTALIHHSGAISILDPVGIYGSIDAATECLQTAWLMSVQQVFGNPASCLRMAFHDAGSYNKKTGKGGANGSIMNMAEVADPRNAGLKACSDLLPGVLAEVQSGGCPAITVADLVQVMGAVGVAVSGGPFCSLLMGRPDTGEVDDLGSLPDKCANATSLVNLFDNYGFADPMKALVVLSGSHSIGRTTTTGTTCAKGNGFMTAQPSLFDNHYYQEVVDKTGLGGWLQSDRTLMNPTTSPPRVIAMMKHFATSNDDFMTSWCRQYREMSLLGVDPRPAGFNVTDGFVPAPWFEAPPPPNAPDVVKAPPPPPSPVPPHPPIPAFHAPPSPPVPSYLSGSDGIYYTNGTAKNWTHPPYPPSPAPRLPNPMPAPTLRSPSPRPLPVPSAAAPKPTPAASKPTPTPATAPKAYPTASAPTPSASTPKPTPTAVKPTPPTATAPRANPTPSASTPSASTPKPTPAAAVPKASPAPSAIPQGSILPPTPRATPSPLPTALPAVSPPRQVASPNPRPPLSVPLPSLNPYRTPQVAPVPRAPSPRPATVPPVPAPRTAVPPSALPTKPAPMPVATPRLSPTAVPPAKLCSPSPSPKPSLAPPVRSPAASSPSPAPKLITKPVPSPSQPRAGSQPPSTTPPGAIPCPIPQAAPAPSNNPPP